MAPALHHNAINGFIRRETRTTIIKRLVELFFVFACCDRTRFDESWMHKSPGLTHFDSDGGMGCTIDFFPQQRWAHPLDEH